MEITFEVRAALNLDHNEITNDTTQLSTQFNLKVDNKLNKSKYLDENNLPNKEGSIAVTSVLVHALVGNIHMAHEKGYRDSAEHLRFIIEELEKGFASVAEVQIGTFKKKEDETN